MNQNNQFTHAVVSTYSFETDTPVVLFTDEKTAIKYLRDTYAAEVAIDDENGQAATNVISKDGCYAKIINHRSCEDVDDVSEWRVTSSVSLGTTDDVPVPIPTAIVDTPTVLTYFGPNRFESYCDMLRGGNVVVVKERGDNPGMSITNAIEEIARKVCKEFDINPETLELYELYVSETTSEEALIRINRVTFDLPGLCRPQWEHLTMEEFEVENFPLESVCQGDSYHS